MSALRFLTPALCLGLIAQMGTWGQNSPPDIYEGAPYFDDSSETTQNILPFNMGEVENRQLHTIDSDDDVDWGICPQSPDLAPNKQWALEIGNTVIPLDGQLLVEVYENGPQSPPTKTLIIPPGQASGSISWWQDPYLDQICCSVRALGSSSPAMSYEICYTSPVGSTLPVNPVVERTIFAAPEESGAGSADAAAQGAVEINPGDGSLYSLHRVEFPGHVLTTADDPDRIEITMRSATLFDRASAGPGQNFPNQSVALFVIETHSALGQPIAFTDPVNITVQFVERTDPSRTDVVTLDTMPGDPSQMRLARDVQVGLEVDFQLLGEPGESVNTFEGVVTLEGLVGLTGSDGKGTWGAAVDPSATVALGLGDLIGHLLGTDPIPEADQDLVDFNDDEGLDAADVVSRFNALNQTP
ncbi:hypothetical protein JXA47_11290 [Candidatus Sumerlaeota bacterium]|nr:hypothetical protein [Candidatus Sumerlaeota bacterium]